MLKTYFSSLLIYSIFLHLKPLIFLKSVLSTAHGTGSRHPSVKKIKNHDLILPCKQTRDLIQVLLLWPELSFTEMTLLRGQRDDLGNKLQLTAPPLEEGWEEVQDTARGSSDG